MQTASHKMESLVQSLMTCLESRESNTEESGNLFKACLYYSITS
jgi:hypothetical protein